MNKIKFNQTEIPFPLTWGEKSNDIKTLFSTEAGTDEIIEVRKDKLSIQFSCKSTSDWASIFKSFYLMDSFTLTRYDVLTGEQEQREVRIENFSANLVPRSWGLDPTVTEGVWEISFSLEEF